ncbi:MAG: signal transduction histidine kinase [Planctomycetota bacterium]|jgi:signal transduction histidine kinase
MLRHISTKWLVAVLVSIAIPFVGYSLYVNQKVSDRLARDVVHYTLQGLSADLATRLDEKAAEFSRDAVLLSEIPTVNWFTANDAGDRLTFRDQVEQVFNAQVFHYEDAAYVLAFDSTGQVVGSNQVDRNGEPLSTEVRGAMRGLQQADEPWFRQCMEQGTSLLDYTDTPFSGITQNGRARYLTGFAARIERTSDQEQSPGLVLVLLDLRYVQRIIGLFGVRQLGRGGRQVGPSGSGEDIYGSSYAWVWSRNASTILAHLNPALVGAKLKDLEGGDLQPLIEAARSKDYGLYPDYEFLGVGKKAAFTHLRTPKAGGLGWVVGVGADNKDIYAPVEDLQDLLLTSTLVALLVATLLTSFVARRITRPILHLKHTTERVAKGELGARVEVSGKDEVGELGHAFNAMFAELEETRDRIVRAEKDAAWREMARQVAHEVKNPLTPISLSVDLLRRAHAEKSPDFESVLERTLDMIQRQVVNMREVTRDFAAFAGEHRARSPVQVGEVVDDVLELSAAWAAERAVVINRSGDSGVVMADPGELRRAVLNLVSNAMEAMPEGGTLDVQVHSEAGFVDVIVQDTGSGLGDDVREHLFEPYFTTRSSGTGLGLAIVRRVVEDMGGSVSLENRVEGAGAVAKLHLPEASA